MLTIDQLEKIKYTDVKSVTSREYFSSDEYAHSMFDTKYCIKYDAEGKPITDSEAEYSTLETPADVFYRVASGLASMEKTKKLQELYTNHWFALMWLGWFRPGGSVLSGVGSPIIKSLLNCTTLPLAEDSLEGISKCDYEIMKCAAFRQGLGFDASVLRPRFASVNNAAEESTGSIPWVEKLVDNGDYVGQKGRKPAILVSLKVHHPDIIEFITAKMEKGKLENANISIQISNSFIEAVKSDSDWELYFEFEASSKYERVSKTVSAKYLFDLIAKTAFESAEPGVQYIDLLREGSMVHQIYVDIDDERFKIISTNACCFTEENHVLTDKGSITIKELQDRVVNGEEFKAMSKNIATNVEEFKDVVNIFKREGGTPVQTITLNLENGKTIECTPDHSFYTKNRGVVQAVDLTIEDDLIKLL